MNIYSFGDSISVGQYVSVSDIWITLVAQALEREYPNQPMMVANPSVNGNTTRMALERMPFDVQSHEVDILLIGFGLNDCMYWQTDKGVPRVSPLAFEANLREMIVRAYNFGSKKVILRTNHPVTSKKAMANPDITYAQSNIYYNTIIRKVGEEEDVVLVDIEKVFQQYSVLNKKTIDDLLLADGVHLSKRGHKLYFDTLYPIIRQNVDSLLHME